MTTNNDQQIIDLNEQLQTTLKTIVSTETQLNQQRSINGNGKTTLQEALLSWNTLIDSTLIPNLNTIHERISVFEQMAQTLSECQTQQGKYFFLYARNQACKYKELLKTEANIILAEHYVADLPLETQINLGRNYTLTLRLLLELDLSRPALISQNKHENLCQLRQTLSARHQQAQLNQLAAVREQIALWHRDSNWSWDISKPIVLKMEGLLSDFTFSYAELLTELATKLDLARLIFWRGSSIKSLSEQKFAVANHYLTSALKKLNSHRESIEFPGVRGFRQEYLDKYNQEKPTFLKLQVSMLHLLGAVESAQGNTAQAEKHWQEAQQTFAQLKALTEATPDFQLPVKEAEEIEKYFASKQPTEQNQPNNSGDTP